MATEQQTNINFVREVEKYPCLYNYKLPEYVRKDKVDKAWSEIGQKFNITGAECKEKWRNIRNVFVRNLKPGNKAPGPKQRKPYYLNEVMQFTVPFIKLHRTPDYGDSTLKDVNQIFNPEDSNEEDITLSIEQQPSSSQFTGISILPNYSSPSPISRPELSPSPPPLVKEPPTDLFPSYGKKDDNRRTSIDKEILEYFKRKRMRNETSQLLEQQPKKMFLLSLLPDMENMSDQQTRTFKRRVLQLVEEIFEED